MNFSVWHKALVWRIVLTPVVVVALTLVSFGHQRLSPGDQAQAEAYLLAGGDWSAICTDDQTIAQTCLACVISATCALADKQHAAALDSVLAERHVPMSGPPIAVGLSRGIASARAPPA